MIRAVGASRGNSCPSIEDAGRLETVEIAVLRGFFTRLSGLSRRPYLEVLARG
jgi:hypothetical protein